MPSLIPIAADPSSGVLNRGFELASGQTLRIPSGATLDATGATLSGLSAGSGFLPGFAYGFATNGAAATAYESIDDAIQATKAAGGGEVFVMPKFPKWDEQVLMRGGVDVHCIGEVDWHYTGLGTMICECPEAEAAQLKVTGDADLRKTIANSCAHGGTIAISGVSTDTITTAVPHGLSVGMLVTFADSTTPPTNLAGGPYFVVTVGSATTLKVSATSGGGTIDATGGTDPQIRRVFRANVASIATSGGVTTVTTSAPHGFPKYFSVTFAGTSTSPPLTNGTFRCTRGTVADRTALNAFTFTPLSGTPTQASAGGTVTMLTEEHILKTRYPLTHFDAHAEHFRMIVSDVPQTDSSKFSAFHCKSATLHVRNHTFIGTNASILHMVTGFVDMDADGGTLGSGAGVATLVFDGDGTAATPSLTTSRFWLRTLRLHADIDAPAAYIKGQHADIFTHFDTQTWNGRFLVDDLVGNSVVWPFFNVHSMTHAEERNLPCSLPVFEVQGENAGAVLLNGKIDLITSKNTGPVFVINNASDGMENEHEGLHIGEISAEPGDETSVAPSVVLTGRDGEYFTLNLGSFRRYRPTIDHTILPIGIQIGSRVVLRGTWVYNCQVEVTENGSVFDTCRFVAPLFDDNLGGGPANVVPCVTAATAKTATFLNCFKGNSVALENVSGEEGVVPQFMPIGFAV